MDNQTIIAEAKVIGIKKKLHQQIELRAAEALVKHSVRMSEFKSEYTRALNHVFFETILKSHGLGVRSLHSNASDRLKMAEIL